MNRDTRLIYEAYITEQPNPQLAQMQADMEKRIGRPVPQTDEEMAAYEAELGQQDAAGEQTHQQNMAKIQQDHQAKMSSLQVQMSPDQQLAAGLITPEDYATQFMKPAAPQQQEEPVDDWEAQMQAKEDELTARMQASTDAAMQPQQPAAQQPAAQQPAAQQPAAQQPAQQGVQPGSEREANKQPRDDNAVDIAALEGLISNAMQGKPPGKFNGKTGHKLTAKEIEVLNAIVSASTG